MSDVFIRNDVEELLAAEGFSGKTDELISLLQFYQKRQGFISPEGVQEIACFLRVSEARVYGVASFYTQFRFVKPGVNTVRVCLGTACHVQGGEQLSDEVQTILGIRAGEITADQQVDFQEVACLGCCAQAPVVEINGKIYGKMTREKVRKILENPHEL
jgi:NADH-quinone oxidoreductase subunit E